MMPCSRFILLVLLAATGCSEPAKKSSWEQYKYLDNDASYTLPAGAGCLDDAPSTAMGC